MRAAESVPEPDETGPDPAEDAPPANPLEAVRRAQAKRSMPPGSNGQPGGGLRGRGANPRSPRQYNRHK